MKDLNDFIAQEMARFEYEFGGDLSLSPLTRIGIEPFLKSLARTVARATAEKLDVEDKETTDLAQSWQLDLTHERNKFWNANNAERRRRLQEWFRDNV